MNHSERNKLIDELLDGCKKILNTKGLDYAGLEDANYNFISIGERLGLEPVQILLVYLHKHIDRITNTIKANPGNPIPHGESMEESIKDSINYLAILHTLLICKQQFS